MKIVPAALFFLLLSKDIDLAAQDSTSAKQKTAYHQAALYTNLFYDFLYGGDDISPTYTIHYKPFEISAALLFSAQLPRDHRENVFGTALHLTYLPFKRRYPVEPFFRAYFSALKWNESDYVFNTSTIPYSYDRIDAKAKVVSVSAEIGLRVNVGRIYADLTLPGYGYYEKRRTAAPLAGMENEYKDFTGRPTSFLRFGIGYRFASREQFRGYNHSEDKAPVYHP